MKIALDIGPLTDGHAGRGIGVYTAHLKTALDELSQKENFVLSAIDAHSYKDLDQFDVIHFPTFDFFKNTLSNTSRRHVVVTIHDTIPLIYPKQYPPGIRGRIALLKQKMALQRVDAIITDSETSKKDIVRFLGVPSHKIFPIYLGSTVLKPNSNSDYNAILKKLQINFPYLLYIGDVNWNKNLVTLAQVCEANKFHLVIVGKRAVSTTYDRDHIENRPLVELQSLLKSSKYLHAVGFVEDAILSILIKKAQALCQPSYYEGFGLSVLDAMTLGTPTICARTQALVEIYEAATVFFNPYDQSDMASQIRLIISNEVQRKKIIDLGKKHAQHFSWDLTAKKTFDVYKKIISEQ